ncbi:uncharacterized protein LOC143501366 [Brachyhypopomus gauderio]|uniref:uncharacterized protein LOC143501366 n=1 Tax=Brachyhypopomus gauderio TaxID=698409 RepID=UPI004043778A
MLLHIWERTPVIPREKDSENVVMKLMEPYLDKGRTITTDNYFTSLSLANRLLACNTALLGTINKIRREIPPSAKNTKGHEEFSTHVYTSGSAILTVYAPKKNKAVCILSTMLTNKSLSPKAAKENSMKCGVDIMDQKKVHGEQKRLFTCSC